MMIIRQTRDIHSNNTLGEYLNKNNIEYSSHTYNSTQLTIYKIFTDSEEHLKNIDKITGGKIKWKYTHKTYSNIPT